MMIQTVRLTRKKAALAVIAAGTVLAALILILGRGGSGEEPSRPQLKGDYVAYNALQKSQGFDLEPCCGKQVTRYTYTVTNYPQRPDGVQLNLYVCEDLPVAGDVVCTGADGFQNTLVFPGEAGESFR